MDQNLSVNLPTPTKEIKPCPQKNHEPTPRKRSLTMQLLKSAEVLCTTVSTIC